MIVELTLACIIVTDIQSHVSKLAWEIESRRSTEMRFRTVITNHDPAPNTVPLFDILEQHFIETADRQRFYDSIGMALDKVKTHYCYYLNGDKAADVAYEAKQLNRQKSIVIKKQFHDEDRSDRREIPYPIQFLYVGRKPLHKALPEAEFVGTSEVLSRQCDVYVFKGVKWAGPQDHVYHLDNATSLPLKVEAYADQSARDRHKPLWVWSAESLDKVQGHFVPLKSSQTAFSENSKPRMTWSFQVQSIKFDEEFPATTFWPTLEPGIGVLDTIQKRTYTVPGLKFTPPSADTDTNPPIQAIPPMDWTGAVSIGVLGLGCLLLIWAVLQRRRR